MKPVHSGTVWFVLVWVGNATFWTYLTVSVASWAAFLFCVWRVTRRLDTGTPAEEPVPAAALTQRRFVLRLRKTEAASVCGQRRTRA